MTGSLQIKKGYYYMVLATQENGRQKQTWKSTKLPVKGNNKRKAEKMLRDTLTEHENATPHNAENVLFVDALYSWLGVSKVKVDIITYEGYVSLLENHILPYFAPLGLTLDKVTRPVLQAYLNEKHENGRLDGKGGLSPASVRHHKNVIYQTMQEAMRNGLIASNPCQFVVLPKVEQYHGSYYNEQELKEFFTAIKDERLFAFVYVTALYGLRRSEALGLKWNAIDFHSGTVTIKRTVCRMKTTVEKEKTKNTTSFRSFPITPEIETILCKLKQEEEENRRLFGNEYHENDYIFKWEDGHPYHPDYISGAFPKLLKRHNLSKIRFHDLRHSSASLLIAQGFGLKEVQSWLGHANIKITADTYGHLEKSHKVNMANRVGNLFPI